MLSCMLNINSTYLTGDTKSQKLAPGVVVPFQKEEVPRTPCEHQVEMPPRCITKLKPSQIYDIIVNKFDEGSAKVWIKHADQTKSVLVSQDATAASNKFLMVKHMICVKALIDFEG